MDPNASKAMEGPKDPKVDPKVDHEFPKWVTVHPSLVADVDGRISVPMFPEHAVVRGKQEVRVLVKDKEEEMRATQMHDYPKWVKLNPARVSRVRDHVSVPEFSEFEVDRATKDVRVLVHSKDEEKRAMEGGPAPAAVKPAPGKPGEPSHLFASGEVKPPPLVAPWDEPKDIQEAHPSELKTAEAHPLDAFGHPLPVEPKHPLEPVLVQPLEPKK
jgi:hypothetical protein